MTNRLSAEEALAELRDLLSAAPKPEPSAVVGGPSHWQDRWEFIHHKPECFTLNGGSGGDEDCNCGAVAFGESLERIYLTPSVAESGGEVAFVGSDGRPAWIFDTEFGPKAPIGASLYTRPAAPAMVEVDEEVAVAVVTPEMLADAFQMDRVGGRYYLTEYGQDASKGPMRGVVFYDDSAIKDVAALLTSALRRCTCCPGSDVCAARQRNNT